MISPAKAGSLNGAIKKELFQTSASYFSGKDGDTTWWKVEEHSMAKPQGNPMVAGYGF